jgi:hypothetical protein
MGSKRSLVKSMVDEDNAEHVGSGANHLSARILLTALEAQYGGSSCLTTSTCSLGSTTSSTKCTSSDSSWTNGTVLRRANDGAGGRVHSTQHESFRSRPVVPGTQPSMSRTLPTKHLGISNTPCMKLGERSSLFASRLAETSQAYDGSASSNNGCSDSENDMDSIDSPFNKVATNVMPEKCLGLSSALFTGPQDDGECNDDSSDICSFSSDNEGSECSRRLNHSCLWDGALGGECDKKQAAVLSKDVSKSSERRQVNGQGVRPTFPRRISSEPQQRQTVANGISILERSVNSKLAAAGASSMREANLKKHQAHVYHEQTLCLAKGLKGSCMGTAVQSRKPSMSARVTHLQMHQTAGVPHRPSFLDEHRLFGQQQQHHRFMKKTGILVIAKAETPKAHIYNVGIDILVQCLAFLEPQEVLSTLTCPLSKTWRQLYCKQGQLWKVLCLAEPFHARLGSSKSGSSDDDGNFSMTTSSTASEMRSVFGQYRLLYTSFVRCIAYVHKIQREAIRQSKDQPAHKLLETTNDSSVSSLPLPRLATSVPGANREVQGVSRAAPLLEQGLPCSFGTFLARARVAAQQQGTAVALEGATLRVDSGAESLQSSLSASCFSSSCSESSDDHSTSSVESHRELGAAVSAPTSIRALDHAEPKGKKRDSSIAQISGSLLRQARKKARESTFTHPASSSSPLPVARAEGGGISSNQGAKNWTGGPKFAPSKLTAALLGSSTTGKSREPGHVDLPWSCAVYAVINWMVAFSDVLGIQVTCLKALPALLEDERQRSTAQLAGLTGIVIRAMITFKDSVDLHTSAFHTLVLLARPLGGKEGMLFHRTMVGGNHQGQPGQDMEHAGANAGQAPHRQEPRGIFEMGSTGQATSTGNGTAVILDSMRRFVSDESLQAMACWSMVNIALIPSQKSMLVRLGGIGVLSQAMMMHPMSAEVQFRALFALINLVIPCEQSANLHEDGMTSRVAVEKGMLDENVGQITHLVVAAMKNFCTTKAILNRACLVLHNLSLNREYHSTLLWAPNCYEMMQWTMTNYPNDRVIEQSTSGTLQRLQQTLREDEDLRVKFCAWLSKSPHSVNVTV